MSTDALRPLRNPLLRNGHHLILSSALTAAVGFAYWTVAAREYDAGSVGSNSAAISMMILVAAIAQLNLSSAMVRFVPTAGRRTRLLVGRAYLLSASVALAVALSTVALVRRFSPGTEFLEGTLPQAMFVGACVAYAIFVVQDGVLTALRRSALVPLENLVFAMAKLGLVVAFAGLLPSHGIFASWALSLGGTVMVVGAYIFIRAIPRYQRSGAAEVNALPPARQIAHFVLFDYIGTIFGIGSMTLLPILVTAELGAEANAYFSIAWLIAYSVHLINANMGTSLVLAAAVDQSYLDRQVRRVLTHTGKLVLGAVIAVFLLTPYLLGIFGQAYQEAGTTLRILVLAALPNLLIATAISSARAQRRMKLVLGIQAAQLVLALPLAWGLLRLAGFVGAGLAWFVTQMVIAAALLIRRDLWLTVGGGVDARKDDGPRWRLGWSMAASGMRLVDALRLRRSLERVAAMVHLPSTRGVRRAMPVDFAAIAGIPDSVRCAQVTTIPTESDIAVVVVGKKGQPPEAVVKAATTTLGSADLRAQRDALAILSADPRLSHQWRALLPQIRFFRDDTEGTLSVETFRPGIDLTTALRRSPQSHESLTSAAIDAIEQLHHCAGEVETVGDRHIAHWVTDPLMDLIDFCSEVDRNLLPVARHLGEALSDALSGRHVLVSWTHGDFTPGNVRIDERSSRVTGLIDWGSARSGQFAALDCYQMMLSAQCVLERRELGTVVENLLRPEHAVEHQRPSLGLACTCTRSDAIDERMLILLAWLGHTAHLRRVSHIYRGHRLWWELNGRPVLRAFGAYNATRETDSPPAGMGR